MCIKMLSIQNFAPFFDGDGAHAHAGLISFLCRQTISPADRVPVSEIGPCRFYRSNNLKIKLGNNCKQYYTCYIEITITNQLIPSCSIIILYATTKETSSLIRDETLLCYFISLIIWAHLILCYSYQIHLTRKVQNETQDRPSNELSSTQ